jgi:hypothetical protein
LQVCITCGEECLVCKDQGKLRIARFEQDYEGNPSRTRRELNVIQAEDAQLARDHEIGRALRQLADQAAAVAAEGCEEKTAAVVAVAEEKAAPANASPR